MSLPGMLVLTSFTSTRLTDPDINDTRENINYNNSKTQQSWREVRAYRLANLVLCIFLMGGEVRSFIYPSSSASWVGVYFPAGNVTFADMFVNVCENRKSIRIVGTQASNAPLSSGFYEDLSWTPAKTTIIELNL